MTLPPWLEGEELVRAAQAGTLPRQWRMRWRDGSLRPLVWPGETLVLGRGAAPGRGALVCVLVGGHVHIRRVLATRDDGALLLHAELAPFDDGWCAEPGGDVVVLGVVQCDTVLARAARLAPRTWTTALWWSACGLARSRSELARLRGRMSWARGAPTTRVHATLTARPVTVRDAPALEAFLLRAYGSGTRREPLAHAAQTHLGAFTDEGLLVGRAFLSVSATGACSHTTMVEPAWRGRGVAARLLEASLALAREAGAQRTIAYVSVRNHASLRAYTRAGFARSGRWWTHPRDPLAAADMPLLELLVEHPQSVPSARP